jgi:hypothetical protein
VYICHYVCINEHNDIYQMYRDLQCCFSKDESCNGVSQIDKNCSDIYPINPSFYIIFASISDPKKSSFNGTCMTFDCLADNKICVSDECFQKEEKCELIGSLVPFLVGYIFPDLGR